MKFALLVFVLAGLAFTAIAENPPIQTTKASKTTRFDAATEVKEYYRTLLQSNTRVRQQFETLARQSPTWDDAHSSPGEPQVVAWYPTEDQWGAGAGFHDDERFLVIQPITFGVPKWESHDLAVVSEFRVLCVGKTRFDPKDPAQEKEQLVSNSITIQFLGFREFSVSPIKASQ